MLRRGHPGYFPKYQREGHPRLDFAGPGHSVIPSFSLAFGPVDLCIGPSTDMIFEIPAHITSSYQLT
jgi:hypothetical protein